MIEPDTLTTVRLDIARIEGMISQFLTDSVRRIEENANDTRNLRADLTTVKDNCHAEVNRVAAVVGINANNISNLEADIKEIQEKQNSTGTRNLAALGALVAVASFLWNVISAGGTP